jgi:presenilin-like A22 family membrane protease
MWYVFYPLLWKIIPYGINLGIVIDIPLSLSIILAASLTFALYKHPEWYVVDAVGIVIAAGAASIFGLSLAILPTMVLLVALAVYDAVAVYKTKHMISLADSVVDLRLPVLLVIPKKSSYSFLKQKRLKETLEKEGEREAMFMGLGDVVMPCILVVSSFRFVGSPVVTFSTLLGGLLGFIILMCFVMKGKPQAGLPLLNSGAILGYLISYYLVFQNTGFGVL